MQFNQIFYCSVLSMYVVKCVFLGREGYFIIILPNLKAAICHSITHLVLQGYSFVVIAALCKFQKAKHATAETGQSWWVASSILCTSLLPAVSRSSVALPDQDAPCGASPGGMKAFARYVSAISRGLPRLSDMCQKISRVRGLPSAPQNLDAYWVASSVSSCRH